MTSVTSSISWIQDVSLVMAEDWQKLCNDIRLYVYSSIEQAASAAGEGATAALMIREYLKTV